MIWHWYAQLHVQVFASADARRAGVCGRMLSQTVPIAPSSETSVESKADTEGKYPVDHWSILCYAPWQSYVESPPSGDVQNTGPINNIPTSLDGPAHEPLKFGAWRSLITSHIMAKVTVLLVLTGKIKASCGNKASMSHGWCLALEPLLGHRSDHKSGSFNIIKALPHKKYCFARRKILAKLMKT